MSDTELWNPNRADEQMHEALRTLLTKPQYRNVFMLMCLVRPNIKWEFEDVMKLRNTIDGISDALDLNSGDVVTALSDLWRQRHV